MGLLSSVLGSFSSSERKLLAILGLLASKKIKTRGESEIQEYVSEKYRKIGRAVRDKMEKNVMDKNAQNILRDSVGMMNSRGLRSSPNWYFW